MKEIIFPEIIEWSFHVDNPKLKRPTKEEWNLINHMINRWDSLPKTNGQRPRIQDPIEIYRSITADEKNDAPQPKKEDFEIYCDVNKESYNHKDPKGSATNDEPGRDYHDELDWEEVA